MGIAHLSKGLQTRDTYQKWKKKLIHLETFSVAMKAGSYGFQQMFDVELK